MISNNKRGRPKNRNYISDSSDSNGTRYSNGNNRANRGEQLKTVLVSGLNRQTVPGTLRDYFLRFGAVAKAALNLDDNEERTGAATISFRDPPHDVDRLIGKHKIDGKTVSVEFTKNEVSDFRNDQHGIQSKMHARSLAMGSFYKPNHFIEEWRATKNVRYCLRYTQRKVEIFFTHLDTDYKLEYNFKDVNGDMKVERENFTTTITIPLLYPALFWKRNYASVRETSNEIKVGPCWDRVILIPLTPGVDITSRPLKPLMPIRRTDCIDIGNWLVLRLTFSPEPRFAREFEENLKVAADYNLVPRDLNSLRPFITVTKSSELPKPFDHVFREKLKIDFDVLYLLESVISRHIFNEYNLTSAFYTTLQDLKPEISCGLLQLISSGKEPVQDPKLAFSRIFEKMGMKVKDQRSIPSHCAMLRKVIITPSHMYIQPPSLETTNRVVRHYRDHADRFIRVQFMDEGFNRVGSSNGRLFKEEIYNRIYDVLKRGIQIGSRRYEFLAFSSSQLREQGCWFFAPTAELNPDMIRSWMGVFSHEKVVAKHAVRMGQCFSSTRPVCTLDPKEVEYIEDVQHNQYVFSDGVGKISPALAEEVAAQMELKSVPSAFQFRLGGAKGVLTVDENLKGVVKVQLRKSQIKFESEHLTLEVIRTSSYINGYLNRQVITLLSSLGVKDEVFLELMENMIKDLSKLLQKPEEAVRVLLGNVDEAGTVTSMVPIIQAGFLERKDPYLLNVLNLFRINILKDLKKKAKITVPKGAYLLGVMDETGTLEENEVFVQIYDTSNNGARKEIITGEVVVFRNPCFHPGDVRVVNAVDRPELHHLTDVIVFPSKGFRDIPSMCSGGDLDGDDYTVYWDPKLLPTIKNFSPMDYTAAKPNIVEDVRIRHIIKFFVNYISCDNLGQIANAHLATADQSSQGARDGKCLLLAQLHSEAVDFPKSGKPANMPEELVVKRFPDFMQKKDKETYESKKVLGRIYRAIDKSDYQDYQSALTDETEYDTRLRVPDMEMYINEAREYKQKYNRDLSALMNQFGVQTEAEICSGYIIKWLKNGKSKTRYEQHEYTMKAVKAFKTVWRKKFEQEFYDSQKVVDLTQRNKIDAKAAAWYYVTYHPEERKRDFSVEGGFLSFPWVIYPYICEIAKRNTHKTLDELTLLQPVDEDTIAEGSIKLSEDRGNVVIMEVSDDEEEEFVIENYDTDGSGDDEIFYNPTHSRYLNIGNGTSPTRANNDNSTYNGRGNFSSNGDPIPRRPLESHQSVVSANATDDDLSKALLGLDL